MNISLIIVLVFLIITNYYYIDQFTKMYQDIKSIKKTLVDEKKK